MIGVVLGRVPLAGLVYGTLEHILFELWCGSFSFFVNDHSIRFFWSSFSLEYW